MYLVYYNVAQCLQTVYLFNYHRQYANRQIFVAAAIIAVVFGLAAVGLEPEIQMANAQGTNGFQKVNCCPIPDTNTCEPTTWSIC
jgi:hypothetical protein